MNWYEFWDGLAKSQAIDDINRMLVIIGCFTMLIIMALTAEHESDVIYTGLFTLLGYTMSRRNEQPK